MELRESPDPSLPFLDTVEGEIAFFRSIMRARPIGLHRHFHVLSIRTVIHQDTGRYVSIDDVWEKLRSCYNIEALENLVRFQKKKDRFPPIEKYTVRNDVLTFFLPFLPPLFRTPKASNLPVPHIPHRAPSTHPLHPTTSPYTLSSVKNLSYHMTKP
jgi:hypothetical protein